MSTLHICPLCEATCGLEITFPSDESVPASGAAVEGADIVVRGDEHDVFSHGFVCPKGLAIGQLHADPDRLRVPLVRREGALVEATWDEAYNVIRARLREVVGEHGPNALGIYLGNPNIHNVASTYYVPALVRALGTDYRFSASTVDQMPKQVASALVFGTELSVPVPDIDRTDLFVVIGANPLVSNGSLMTAPDMPGRIRSLRKRGGRMIVIDPVRTRTARAADLHLTIRPGSDVFLLGALVRMLIDRGASLGAAAPWIDEAEVRRIRDAVDWCDTATASMITGIEEEAIRALADEIYDAPSAAVYARMGTTTSGWTTHDGELIPAATVASWLVDVIATVSGNLDRAGGMMWPLAATGGPTFDGEAGRGRGVRIPGSRRTRVRGLPSVLGEFPASAMAEEMEGCGEGADRLRAMVVIGGNPLVSTPDVDRLGRAMSGLDFMLSVDAYLTETAALADVVLPVPSPLARPHCDIVFANLAVRNAVRYSPAIVGSDVPDEAHTLLMLTCIAAGIAGADPEPTPQQIDDLVAFEVARRASATPASPLAGRDVAEILALTGERRGVERLVDIALRGGPYALTLDDVLAAPHGIDLGPLMPRLPGVLRTPSGAIELAPPVLLADLRRLADAVSLRLDGNRERGAKVGTDHLVLVGRRQLRTSNSWLRNLPLLAGGSARCTLQIHPDDAAARGVADGIDVVLRSATGEVLIPAEVTADVMRGVVCAPHGWSTADWGSVMREREGANVNAVTPGDIVDPLGGTAVLNGIPVTVIPVTSAH